MLVPTARAAGAPAASDPAAVAGAFAFGEEAAEVFTLTAGPLPDPFTLTAVEVGEAVTLAAGARGAFTVTATGAAAFTGVETFTLAAGVPAEIFTATAGGDGEDFTPTAGGVTETETPTAGALGVFTGTGAFGSIGEVRGSSTLAREVTVAVAFVTAGAVADTEIAGAAALATAADNWSPEASTGAPSRHPAAAAMQIASPPIPLRDATGAP
jgi:hypothetical protein